MNITAATRTFALLGDPVSHSLSPSLHNAAFAACALDAVYVALRCSADAVAPLMRALADAGGGGNITVPHKAAAAAALDQRTDAVAATGACNTFWSEAGRLCGDNTDVAGFTRAARALGAELRGAVVLVIGAGGAAAAVAHALLQAGSDTITLFNRTREHALRLADRLDPDRRAIACVDTVDATRRYDLVVNATTLGMHDGDALPFAWTDGARVGAALDLVYSPDDTAWVREARRRGVPAADGKTMLVEQAAAAFESWWGRAAPLEAMRSALAECAPL